MQHYSSSIADELFFIEVNYCADFLVKMNVNGNEVFVEPTFSLFDAESTMVALEPGKDGV